MAIDTSWANVSLLCPFDADLLDVKGHTITVSGGAALSAAHAPTGSTKSLYLDGNNDYLSLSHADLALGSGDWAIEFPLYRAGDTTTGTANAAVLLDFRTTEPNVAININLQGSTSGSPNKITVWINGANRITSTSAIGAAFVWVTLAKVSGTLRLFFGGVQEGSNYTDGNTYSTTTLRVGGLYTPTSGDYRSPNAYIGPLRITKAGRGYSTTFTPPTLPYVRPTISGHVYDASAAPVAKTILVRDRSTQLLLGGVNSDPSTGAYTFYPADFGEVQVERLDELADPYWGNVVFASRLNAAGFPTLTGQTLTATGTVTDSAAVADPFGGSQKSALFSGAGSYLNTGASSSLLPGTTYTIKGWIYTTSFAAVQGLFFVGTYGANANRTQGALYTDGTITFFGEGTGGATIFNVATAAGTIALNTWYFIECVRQDTNAYIFVGGGLAGYGVASGTEPTGNNLYLGYARTSATNRGLTGRLFEVQFSHRAEHVAAYTPPTTPFLVGPADGGSGENALIYDRVIPGG